MTSGDKPEKPGSSNTDTGRRGRDVIARVVVVGSFLTVFLMVSVLVVLAQTHAGDAASGVAEKAFNAVLPVVAGWVGTVLAFYFSSASQERTNEMLDKALDRASGRPGDGTVVAEKMIPVGKILELRDLNTTKPKDIKLDELRENFERKPNPIQITRLVFLESGVFKYVLHVGLLSWFLMKNKGEGQNFEALLNDPKILSSISKLVAFVPVTATLADAKVALDKVIGGQDIIVTATGNPTEPMLGWLPNVDLTRALTVS
jgi:hypothetical protein